MQPNDTLTATCNYLVLATPRTGSQLLCDLLIQSGVAGQPEEFFAPDHPARLAAGRDGGVADYAHRLRSDLAERDHGVFGARVMWRQMTGFLLPGLSGRRRPSLDEARDALAGAFPDLRILHLRRRDRRRQALSYARALEGGDWVRLAEAPAPAEPGAALVAKLTRRIMRDEAGLAAFLRDGPFPVIELAYEDIAADPPAALARSLRFLDLPVGPEVARIRPRMGRFTPPHPAAGRRIA